MKQVVAIDYGTKRVGVAVNRHTLAEPLVILDNNDQLLVVLAELIGKEGADLVLVGMSENKMAQQTSQFAEELSTHISVPVEMIDETLSSQQVSRMLAEADAKLKKRQGPIDHYAAAVILQEWLDLQ